MHSRPLRQFEIEVFTILQFLYRCLSNVVFLALYGLIYKQLHIHHALSQVFRTIWVYLPITPLLLSHTILIYRHTYSSLVIQYKSTSY